LAHAIEDAELLVVPSVCIYGVFKVVLRKRGEDDAFSVAAAMQTGTMVDLDARLALEAASIGQEEELAFADSVIYAIARRHSATLWTQDAQFSGRPGVQFKPKARRPEPLASPRTGRKTRFHPFFTKPFPPGLRSEGQPLLAP
jgi:predicted nucleic acid-binding protein